MFRLTRHPDSICDAVDRIEVEIVPTDGGASLLFRAFGRIGDLRVPIAAEQPDADRLWESTCFEMFARTAGEARYTELNLSPSGKWVHFSFMDYRAGRDRLRTVPPDIEVRVAPACLELSGYAVLPNRGPLLIGLSAVIEEASGRKSYWALAHPPGSPDFHHPDCFALELPAPEPA